MFGIYRIGETSGSPGRRDSANLSWDKLARVDLCHRAASPLTNCFWEYGKAQLYMPTINHAIDVKSLLVITDSADEREALMAPLPPILCLTFLMVPTSHALIKRLFM